MHKYFCLKYSWLQAICLLVSFSSLFGLLYGWSQKTDSLPNQTLVVSQTGAVPSRPTAAYQKPIEEVQLGERVLANNPAPDQSPNFLTEPDAETWRKLQLVLLQERCDLFFIGLLRPVNWIEEHHLEPAAIIELSLPGLVKWFRQAVFNWMLISVVGGFLFLVLGMRWRSSRC